MTVYNIYLHSNEHARTINTPMNGRINWTKIVVHGKDALLSKVAELRRNGERITEICTNLGARIYL